MKKLLAFLLFTSILTSASAQVKIGVVNSNRVLDTIPSRRLEIKEIEMIREFGRQEISAMDSTLKEMYKEYNSKDKVEMPGLIDRVDGDYKIRMFQSWLEEREQIIEEDLKRLSEDLSKRSLETVRKATEIVSQRLKLQLVVDKSVALYSVASIDITNLVIQEMLKLDTKTKQ